MKTLIAITTFTLFLITSYSYSQDNSEGERRLIAKVEIDTSARSSNLIHNEGFKERSRNSSEFNNRDSENFSSQELNGVILNNRSRDISLLIKEELEIEGNLDLEYRSPKLKFDDLPLSMSTKDKKTKGIVLPPFLYIKQQF